MNFVIGLLVILGISVTRAETLNPQKKMSKEIVTDKENKYEASSYFPKWYLGVDLINSLAFEYHFDNKFVLDLEQPFAVENSDPQGGYSTTSKLVYTLAIRGGFKSFDFGDSKGFVFLSLGNVKGTGTVNVNTTNPSSTTSGHTVAIKYSHRWYWPHFALGVGGGYRHNSISNVMVPYSSGHVDIKNESRFWPLLC